ncbi:DNA helicase RecQ [Zoogloea sp. LCSB751]|uniref:DNA helicase RecQ n=1 Tax=Zoogloea sp. LCSB751 TaxID=1965277 RepID=UPI0009A4B0F8|nr:DNA helicase RecQ [Zoogloea sp. LCSB751]
MSRARETLFHVFGYTQFRGPQEDIVEHVAAGGDALVLMPTGGGKSLCYQIPALLRPGVAIVVSPLIALMQDQVSALKEVGAAADFLNSSLSFERAMEIERAMLAGALDLLYVAPERLVTPRFLDLLDHLHESGQLALFAIDEAHCVSQWGHDFRPEYLQLSILPERYPQVPRIALTATADAQTRREIAERLRLLDAREFVSSFDRPNIRYTIVPKDNPRAQLLAFLKDGHMDEAGIVYCSSRKKVDETAAWLQEKGIAALPYHAGMGADERALNQDRFLREDGIVMVATVAFGMGIDKPDVRFVAHLDLPRSIEGYYQETGRAGRDGQAAEAWMAYSVADLVQQRRFIDQGEAGDEVKRVATAKLDALLGLCETTGCRRQRLLGYFDEDSEPCGNCDTCLHPPQVRDASESAKKALSCVFRTGSRFGAGHVVDVLLGKTTDKVKEWQHDQVSTFGIGSELDDKGWRTLIRQLVAHGALAVDHERYGALTLTEAARPILRGEASFTLRIDTAPAKKGRKGDTTRKLREWPEATGEEAALLDRLRAWRAATAKERNVPAYVIFHDATLRDIARQRPDSIEALATISGVGDRKLDAYGEDILAVLAET